MTYKPSPPGARQATSEIAEISLVITLTPNPVVDGHVRAVVQGAAGQPLQVTLLDLQGRTVGQQAWSVAEARQVIDWDISGNPISTYLLQVQAGN